MELPPIQFDRETFLRDHATLAPLPAVVNRVVRAISSGRSNATEIAQIIASDAGLTAQVLKIVNSAYYGLPSRIGDIRHAVAYLGLAEIQRLILTAHLMKFASLVESDAFRDFWFHSFHTSLATCPVVRRYFKGFEGTDLRTAALLHDIGKLVYLKFYPEHYTQMKVWCDAEGRLMTDAEAHFGFPPHSLLGSILCERWMLPSSVQRASERHELVDLGPASERRDGNEQTLVITLANLLSVLTLGRLSNDMKATLREAIQQSVGSTDQEFLLLMGEVYSLRADVESFLNEL